MRIERIFVAACLPFLFVAGARPQSLTANPGFAQDLSGWNPHQGSAVWTSQDAGGSPFSGSLLATPVGGSSAGILSDCFPASPGAYSAASKFYMPEAGNTTLTMFLRWYADGNCSQLIFNSTSLGGYFPGPPWFTIDTRAYGVDLIAPAGTRSAALQLFASAKAYVDDVVVQRQSACASEACLNGDRFIVTVRWRTGNQNGGGRQVKLSSDSAYFWFFDPSNVELVVKVLDGCPVNGHYWVFMGGLTNVGVDITITDVATGTTRTYMNLEGQPFQPVQDTSAFPTCP